MNRFQAPQKTMHDASCFRHGTIKWTIAPAEYVLNNHPVHNTDALKDVL